MKSVTKIFFVLIPAFTCLGMQASAQVKQDALKKTIYVPVATVRIDSLLGMFSKQTGIGFSFNSKKISPSKKISVNRERQTLGQWLVQLEQNMGVQHKWVGNHVVLIDNSSKSAHATASHKSPASGAAVQAGKPLSSSTQKNGNITTTKNAAPGSSHPSKKASVEPTRIDAIVVALHQTLAITISDTLAQPLTDSAMLLPTAGLQPKEASAVKATSPPEAGHGRKNKEQASSAVYALSKLDIGFQGVGVSFERKLSQNTTIDFNLGLGGGYAITGQQFKYQVGGLHGPDIYASVNPRFYYNRAKRFSQGKSLKANAGNYFGFRVKYVTDALAENFVVWDALLFNIHWGIQRPLGRRWTFNGHIGPGYGFAKSLFFKSNFGLNHYYGSVEFRFSYLFNKEK